MYNMTIWNGFTHSHEWTFRPAFNKTPIHSLYLYKVLAFCFLLWGEIGHSFKVQQCIVENLQWGSIPVANSPLILQFCSSKLYFHSQLPEQIEGFEYACLSSAHLGHIVFLLGHESLCCNSSAFLLLNQ